MGFIAFLIVGYSEISPGVCKTDYFTYKAVETIIMPCRENSTLPIEKSGIHPYISL